MSQKIDPLQVMAMTIYAGALLERCREMIARLTTASTFAAEIEDFREQAARHIDEAVVTAAGFSSTDIEEVKKLARESIDDVCSGWLSDRDERQSGKRTLN